jgi:exopolysaccharide biosynthesis polyprenyl glycosylphosphotransferase
VAHARRSSRATSAKLGTRGYADASPLQDGLGGPGRRGHATGTGMSGSGRRVDELGERFAGLRQRLLGQVAPELVGLWLIEFALGTLLLYALFAGAPDDGGPFGKLRAINQSIAVALTFGLTSMAVGLYSADVYLRTQRLLVDTAVGVLLAAPLVWLVGRGVGIDVAALVGLNARLAAQVLLAWAVLLCLLRLGFSYALRANLFVRRVVVIGSEASASRLAEAIGALRRGFFEAVPMPASGAPSGRLWGVIVARDAIGRETSPEIDHVLTGHPRVYSETEFWERELRCIDIDRAGADASAFAPRRLGRLDGALQRLVDIALSLSLLVFTLPLMLLTALLIKIDSPGPALYRQERVGLNGQVFTLLKFRSMRADAEARGPVWAQQSDPRVTRVGAFIRLVRIDELPQLLNVLRGQMSFIGPRPERPHFVAQLEQILPLYGARAGVKPGLTGWAQVNYPYGASVEDARSKLSYDLYYVKNRGPLLDLMILFATVRVVLFRSGAR